MPQGTGVAASLGLENGKDPFDVELFGGPFDGACFFHDGALSVLGPCIDGKKLVVRSGQTGMGVVATPKWDAATAQSRMGDLLSAYDTGRELDAVLAPSDNFAVGVLSSLEDVGYGSGATKLPVVTGQDCQVRSVESTIAGEQTSSMCEDTRDLAKLVVRLVDASLTGSRPETDDTDTCDDGKRVIPTDLPDPVLVTQANREATLVGGGRDSPAQLGP